MAMGSCIGVGDGQPCPCITYEEELINDRRRCLECHHGKSRHCGTSPAPLSASGNQPQAADAPVSADVPTNQGPPNNLVPRSMNPIREVTVGNQLSLLEELLQKPKYPGPSVSIGGKAVSKEDARAEALKGFRPKSEVMFLALTKKTRGLINVLGSQTRLKFKKGFKVGSEEHSGGEQAKSSKNKSNHLLSLWGTREFHDLRYYLFDLIAFK